MRMIVISIGIIVVISIGVIVFDNKAPAHEVPTTGMVLEQSMV